MLILCTQFLLRTLTSSNSTQRCSPSASTLGFSFLPSAPMHLLAHCYKATSLLLRSLPSRRNSHSQTCRLLSQPPAQQSERPTLRKHPRLIAWVIDNWEVEFQVLTGMSATKSQPLYCRLVTMPPTVCCHDPSSHSEEMFHTEGLILKRSQQEVTRSRSR